MTYQQICKRLAAVCDEREARAVARFLLEACFGCSLADVASGAVERLSADELEPLLRRLESGEPVQYVAGRADFCGRWFAVRPGVLIPRPETAELCRWVAASLPSCPAAPTLLDVGTGSGCIAVTLALQLPSLHVEAWDVSAEALATARENARQLGADVRFELRDMRVPDDGGRRYGAIVSNPPYVCLSEKAQMEAHVVGDAPSRGRVVPPHDPLLFYRALARLAVATLVPGGWIYLEINPLQASALCRLLAAEGLTAVEQRADQFGRQRFVRCRA